MTPSPHPRKAHHSDRGTLRGATTMRWPHGAILTADPSRTAPTEKVRRTMQVGTRKHRAIGRWVIFASALMLCALLIVAAAVRRHASAKASRWLTERARRSDVHVTIAATGKTQSLTTVEVGAEVTGKVLRVLVDYNDSVTQGQVLAEIDPEQLRAGVEQSNAQVLTAKAGIRTAMATLHEARQARIRVEEMAKQALASQRDLESAMAAAERAEANLTSAKANARLAAASLKSAQSRLAKATIVAPIDGVVLGRAVEPGQTVTAGFQTPILFRIADDLTKLSLHVDIDEADIGSVTEGTTATFTVDAHPRRTFSSKVLSLRNEPKSSQNVVTYEAVLTVDNSERLLRPGMTATATITSVTVKDVLVVSNAALRFAPSALPGAEPAVVPSMRKQEKRVFVLRGGEPVAVAVRAGASDGQVTEVSGDIKAGDEVIVDAVPPS